jgi:hypothetical protein
MGSVGNILYHVGGDYSGGNQNMIDYICALCGVTTSNAGTSSVMVQDILSTTVPGPTLYLVGSNNGTKNAITNIVNPSDYYGDGNGAIPSKVLWYYIVDENDYLDEHPELPLLSY